MKRLALSLALPAASALMTMATTPDRPNILLFMVDDMGWQDTSVPMSGDTTAYNRMFHTPNMERLAASGMKFTQAYASPISSPSRCSLMTGANAARHGVTNWTLRRDATNDEGAMLATMAPPEWNYNGIQRVEGIPHTYVGPSFVQELKDNGYHTIHVGKAHFGAMDTPGEDPHHWGFEVNVAGSAAGGLATYLSERNFGHDKDGNPVSPFAVPDLEKYWGSGTFATEALTQEAIKRLDKAKTYGTPWFMYMSHYAVHVPIDRDPRFYQKYIDQGLQPKDAAYASLVEGMDKSLGDLLDWIERNGEADNTIVIFMSDNGGLAAAESWRDGALHTQNAPLRSGKGSLYEGGIREPMIVRWPGKTRPGSVQPHSVIIEDFYPTILEMAGIKDSDHYGYDIDGRSFVPLITGKGNPSRNRDLVWNFPNVWGLPGPGIDMNCALRYNNWKLIYSYATGTAELYDIDRDISESHDLSYDRPDILHMMQRRLGDALRKVGAQRPTIRANGAVADWPDHEKRAEKLIKPILRNAQPTFFANYLINSAYQGIILEAIANHIDFGIGVTRLHNTTEWICSRILQIGGAYIHSFNPKTHLIATGGLFGSFGCYPEKANVPLYFFKGNNPVNYVDLSKIDYIEADEITRPTIDESYRAGIYAHPRMAFTNRKGLGLSLGLYVTLPFYGATISSGSSLALSAGLTF